MHMRMRMRTVYTTAVCSPSMTVNKLVLAAGLMPELSVQIVTTTAAMYHAPTTQLRRKAQVSPRHAGLVSQATIDIL